METHRIYCSACDREVTIQIVSPDQERGDDNALMNVVCLELGEQCTGTFCPICAQPAPIKSRSRRT
jgi:hypothetical protein